MPDGFCLKNGRSNGSNRSAAHIAAIEHRLASGRLRLFCKNFGVNQPQAVRNGIAMRLRELLALRTFAAGAVLVAN
jgi:hypothetical protein